MQALAVGPSSWTRAPGRRFGTYAALALCASVAVSVSLRGGLGGSAPSAASVRPLAVLHLHGANPALRFTASFAAGAARITNGGSAVTFQLGAYGRPGSMRAITVGAPAHVSGATVTYRYPELREWYRNSSRGLEQGFTIGKRLPGAGGPLTLWMGVSGMHAQLDGGSVVLGSGRAALRYGGLVVTDATGRRLPARLTLRANALQIVIDDSHAVYPLAVDPYVQQGANLLATGEIGDAFFGLGAAISSDGSTVIVGAPQQTNGGVADVFTLGGSSWTDQAAITLPGASATAYFGDSAALSSDGNVALIGAPGAREVAVFTRSGSTWTLQSTITAPAGITGFGDSVGLSGDGSRALIGDSGSTTAASNVTTAFIYNHTGASTWTQAAELAPAGEANNGTTFNPASVALSADGATALLGNAADDGGAGSAWVYALSGASWVPQGGRLSGSDPVGPAGFGGATALSANGNTAAIGAPNDDCYDGAGYVFARSGSTWTQQSGKLTNIGLLGSCPEGGPTFGFGAALTADGTTALFGGGDPAAFTLSAGTWSEYQTDFQGGGLASLSGDGAAALLTCPGCGAVGFAYVYAAVAGLSPLPPPVPAALQVNPLPPHAGARIAGAGAVGVRYKVNVASSTTVQVLEREAGAQSDGVCVAVSSALAGSPPCSRFVAVTHSVRHSAKGSNHFTLPASTFPAAGTYELRLIVNRQRARRSGLLMKTFHVGG